MQLMWIYYEIRTVTFRELKKRVTLELAQQQSMLSDRLQNKPFWISDKQQHKLEDIKSDGGLLETDPCENNKQSSHKGYG